MANGGNRALRTVKGSGNLHIVKKRSAGEKKQTKAGSFDFVLLFVIVLLVLFGLVMVFSSSYYYTLTRASFNNDMYYFIKRQGMWAVIGTIVMIVAMNFPYKYLRRFTLPLYIFTNLCLVLVLIVGTEANGSKRWLGIGGLSFQP